jgi:UDP-N-acetylglucosamine--N-acetylmuramyl-(pentapeptide) pyrophosphoryl-undecaprenol N-acetylglucosamine transferase
MEQRLAQDAGLVFRGIAAGKYRRLANVSKLKKLTDVRRHALNIRDSGRAIHGLTQAIGILRRFKPDAVFVKGGGVGLPVGLAARLLGIPLVVHESDVTPGIGTKTLAKYAAKIAVGFPVQAYSTLPHDRLVFVGAPLRQEHVGSTKAAGLKRFKLKSTRPVVLVVGGSQGARAINNAVIRQFDALTEAAQVLHVAGSRDYPELAQVKVDSTSGYQLLEFLDGRAVGDAYAAADIVVARAGANTIAELAANSKPAIIIPISQSAAHQQANARVLERANAAIILSEDHITELSSTVQHALVSPKRLKQLSADIAAFNNPNAASQLAALIRQVADAHTNGGVE